MSKQKFYQDEKQLDALAEARKTIGMKEIVGPKDNPSIVSMFDAVGHSWVKDDETAWCAAFVGAMLERCGLASTRKLNARSYLSWGVKIELEDALPGDIVVFYRGDPAGWQGHVGFYIGHGGSLVQVLGGNQGNEVSISNYPITRLLGVRRMPGLTRPKAPPAKGTGGGLLGVLASLFGRFFK